MKKASRSFELHCYPTQRDNRLTETNMLSSPHRRWTASFFAFATFLMVACSGFQLRTSVVRETAVDKPLMMFFADEIPLNDYKKEKSVMEPEIATELESATLETVMEAVVEKIETTSSVGNIEEKKEKNGADREMVTELETATLKTEEVAAKELEIAPRVRNTAVGKSSRYGGLQLLAA